MIIPIVMTSDRNYILPTKVAIWSMRNSTDENIVLDFTVICSPTLDYTLRKALKELENRCRNLRISFFNVDLNCFKTAKTVGHVPSASLYRLIIDAVVQDDKCLYLDGDLLVYEDLGKLFSNDVKDYYIAGIKDNWFRVAPDVRLKHTISYGMNIDEYVNAGVLIFNLSQIRENSLQEKFLKEMEKGYPYMDQDILNKICQGRIKHLEPKYNMFNVYMLKHMLSEGGILHFAGYYKPWNNLRIRGAKEWWQQAKEVLKKEEYDGLYQQAEEKTRKGDWSYLIHCCQSEKNINIVGYSDIGSYVARSLKRCGIIAKIRFCDNGISKINLSDESQIIYSVEELVSKHPDALWINASQRYRKDIFSQLIGLGIQSNRIVDYFDKPIEYLEGIEDEWLEHEMREAWMKVSGNVLGK